MTATPDDVRRQEAHDALARAPAVVRPPSRLSAPVALARRRAATLLGFAIFAVGIAAPSVEWAWRRDGWAGEPAAASSRLVWTSRVADEPALAKARAESPADVRSDFDRAFGPALAATVTTATALRRIERTTRAAFGLVVAFAVFLGAVALAATGRRGGGALAALAGAAVVVAFAWMGREDSEFYESLSENAAAVAGLETDVPAVDAWRRESEERVAAGQPPPPFPAADYRRSRLGMSTSAMTSARNRAADAAGAWKIAAFLWLSGAAMWFFAIPLVDRDTPTPWLDAKGRRRRRARAEAESSAVAPGP